MDYGLVGSAMVVIMLLTFVAIICWAWSDKRRQDFRAAAHLPLENDRPTQSLPREHR